MRRRGDGRHECGFSELDAAQRAEAVAMLPPSLRRLSACPVCQGRMAEAIVCGRQKCKVCKRESYPPPWRGDAHKLYWLLDAGRAHVVDWDRDIRF